MSHSIVLYSSKKIIKKPGQFWNIHLCFHVKARKTNACYFLDVSSLYIDAFDKIHLSFRTAFPQNPKQIHQLVTPISMELTVATQFLIILFCSGYYFYNNMTFVLCVDKQNIILFCAVVFRIIQDNSPIKRHTNGKCRYIYHVTRKKKVV